MSTTSSTPWGKGKCATLVLEQDSAVRANLADDLGMIALDIYAIIRKIGSDSTVLLKNKGGALPLTHNEKFISILGANLADDLGMIALDIYALVDLTPVLADHGVLEVVLCSRTRVAHFPLPTMRSSSAFWERTQAPMLMAPMAATLYSRASFWMACSGVIRYG
jgi:hypothetical protein